MGSYTDFWFDFKLVNSPYEVRRILLYLECGEADQPVTSQHPFFEHKSWNGIFNRMKHEPHFVKVSGNSEYITTVQGFTCLRDYGAIELFFNWLQPWAQGSGIWNYLGSSFDDYDYIPTLYFNPVGPFGPDEPHFPDDNKNGWVRI
jgi:hypothetical protein